MRMNKSILLLIVAVTLLAISAFAAPDQSYTGWVMDKKCAAKGATANEECAKKCIESGEPMVLVNDSDKQILTVANPKALENHIGHHVKVQGSVSGDKLTVTSAEMVPAGGK